MAGDAAAAPAQTADGGQAQQGDGAGQAFDPQAIQQQLETFGEGQAELRQLLQGFGEQIASQQQPEAEPEPETLDLSQFMDPMGDPEQQSQQLQQLIDQRINDGIQRAMDQNLSPLSQQVQDMRQQQELAELVGEFPILGSDPQAAQQLYETANAYGAEENWPSEVVGSAKFLRLITMAAGFQRAMAEEQNNQSAGADAGVQLEQAGGAGPLGFGPDAAQAIVNAGGRRGSGALPF